MGIIVDVQIKSNNWKKSGKFQKKICLLHRFLKNEAFVRLGFIGPCSGKADRPQVGGGYVFSLDSRVS
jgi:hypothetical protein